MLHPGDISFECVMADLWQHRTSQDGIDLSDRIPWVRNSSRWKKWFLIHWGLEGAGGGGSGIDSDVPQGYVGNTTIVNLPHTLTVRSFDHDFAAILALSRQPPTWHILFGCQWAVGNERLRSLHCSTWILSNQSILVDWWGHEIPCRRRRLWFLGKVLTEAGAKVPLLFVLCRLDLWLARVDELSILEKYSQ